MKQKLVYMITKANWGGSQKAVYELATHPKIYNNYDVTVVSGSDGELFRKLEEKKIKTLNLNIKNNLSPFGLMLNFIKVLNFIKKEKPNILHLHGSKISLLGSIAGRLLKTKLVIFTSHGWPHNEDRNFFVKNLLRAASHITVALSHRTIAVSKNIINGLNKNSFISRKITLIYNGIKKDDTKKLPKLSEGSSTTHILSVGELNDNKNHNSFINILPQIKNVHYHIIGEGRMRGAIEKSIIKNGLQKKVTLYGHINNAKDIISQYDIFLLPSKTEALPYVILEALQNGIPVIAKDVGGIKEIIDGLPYAKLYNYDTDLIDIFSTEKDARSLFKLKRDFVWSDKRFDFENMIDKTLYLYK